jgi:hypothetical protein
MKKIIFISLITLAFISLSSCRSMRKGSDCGFGYKNTVKENSDIVISTKTSKIKSKTQIVII